MSDNRRKDPRYDLSITAEVQVGEDLLEGQTKNMSASGVSVEVDQELEDGVQVSLTLLLTQGGIEDPNTDPLDVAATVMWCAPKEDGGAVAGLRFEELNQAQKERLAALLESA